MRKLKKVFAILMISGFTLASCTPDTISLQDVDSDIVATEGGDNEKKSEPEEDD